MAEGRNRDLRLDLLRGYCLLSMVVDHVGERTSWLYWVTGKSPFSLITGVDGFVLISGFLTGSVLRGRIERDGFASAALRSLGRALRLYWVTVALSVVYLALGKLTPLLGFAPETPGPMQTVASVLAMHLTWDDVLPLYVLLLALAPGIVLLLQHGRTGAVLLTSAVVWLCHLIDSRTLTLPFDVIFPPAAWQVVFLGGLVAGYHRGWLAQWRRALRGRAAFLAVIVSALALFALNVVIRTASLERFWPRVDFTSLYANLYDWYRLTPLRLLATFTWVVAAYHLLGRVWEPVSHAVGWLLIPLGQASLYVFAMHLLVVTLVRNVPGFGALPDVLYGFALLVPVLVLWAMVRMRFLFGLVPR